MRILPISLSFDNYTPNYRVTTNPSIEMYSAFFVMSFGDGEMIFYGKDYTEENRRNQMIEKIKRK